MLANHANKKIEAFLLKEIKIDMRTSLSLILFIYKMKRIDYMVSKLISHVIFRDYTIPCTIRQFLQSSEENFFSLSSIHSNFIRQNVSPSNQSISFLTYWTLILTSIY